MKKRVLCLPLLLLWLLLAAGCGAPQGPAPTGVPSPAPTAAPPAESGQPAQQTEVEFGAYYTAPEDVAAYLDCYEQLPPNFITKQEARDLGWVSSEGNLWEVAPGMSIGGDAFGNREGLLPDGDWYECDVNYAGGYRGGERVVWSDDGLIYYTGDHYESFELLYE